MRDQPGDGEGIRSPVVFDTVEEAAAHQAKVERLEAALLAMTPAERVEWFALNSGNIDDVLETLS